MPHGKVSQLRWGVSISPLGIVNALVLREIHKMSIHHASDGQPRSQSLRIAVVGGGLGGLRSVEWSTHRRVRHVDDISS